MTSIVPNRTQIEGKVLSIDGSASHEDFNVVKIRTSKVDEVANFANLIHAPDASVLEVHVPREVVEKCRLKEGARLAALVRKSPKEIFIIADSVVVK